MFDSTNVDVKNNTDVHIKNEAKQQVLEIKKETKNSFFVHCTVGDRVWHGLLCTRPFLNKKVSGRATCYPIFFDKDGNIQDGEIESSIQAYLTKNAVIVHQIKLLDKSKMALIEVSWVNPDNATAKTKE